MSADPILALHLRRVIPSASIAAKARADEMRASGREIIDFTVGEPDFPTPRHIVEAGIDALNSGATRYVSSAGILELRRAVVDKLKSDNNLAFKDSEVVIGCGAKHVIFNAFSASLNPGDEVIVPSPYWVSYPAMAAIHGGVPIVVDCPESEGFKLTAAALERAITRKTKWLVLNSPNNPTGAVYSAAELAALGAVLSRHPHVWVLSDEIYEHFTYRGVTHTSILEVAPELRRRTLIVNGVSKAYAMTGWRVGYGAGPEALVRAITMLITQSTTCTTAAAQHAAIAALSGPQGCVEEAVQMFGRRLTRMAELLNAVDGISCKKPEGAFYIFASVAGLLGRSTPQGKRLDCDADVADFLREEAGVVTIDGTSYGLSPYLRFSFATSSAAIDAGCMAVARAVSGLIAAEKRKEK